MPIQHSCLCVTAAVTNYWKACTQKNSPNSAAFTSDEKACLQSLHFTEMHWRRNDVADPTPSTCAWLLEHPKYCDWLGQDRGMLWIKGKPGAGKSTVLKHALETAERETKKSIILACRSSHSQNSMHNNQPHRIGRSAYK